MSEVFDLDVVAAEVAKEPFRFRYDGRQWAMAHISDVDWRVIAKADTGDLEAVRTAFRSGLGDQYEEFDRLNQPISAMTALFNQWLKHAGLREGESQASPDSSENTARPSNRASRRATKSTPGASSRAR